MRPVAVTRQWDAMPLSSATATPGRETEAQGGASLQGGLSTRVTRLPDQPSPTSTPSRILVLLVRLVVRWIPCTGLHQASHVDRVPASVPSTYARTGWGPCLSGPCLCS